MNKKRSHIEHLTQQSKSSFLYSFLLMPRKKRDAIVTVYAYCRHTDDIVDEIADKDLAQRTLDEWREELEACYNGQPRHPITRALNEVNQDFRLPKAYFSQLIDGCEMDLKNVRYQTFDELANYCYHVACVVGLICLEIFGYRSEQSKDYAINLGMALQLTNIIRDVGEDAAIGRIYLPQEEMHRFGYSEDDLHSHRYTPQFLELMRFQAERAHQYFAKARSGYDHGDHYRLFPAEIMHKIYYDLLLRIESSNFRVFGDKIRVPGSKKIRIAIRKWASGQVRGVIS